MRNCNVSIVSRSTVLFFDHHLFSLQFISWYINPTFLVSPLMLTPFRCSLTPSCPHFLNQLNIHDPSLASLPYNVHFSCYSFVFTQLLLTLVNSYCSTPVPSKLNVATEKQTTMFSSLTINSLSLTSNRPFVLLCNHITSVHFLSHISGWLFHTFPFLFKPSNPSPNPFQPFSQWMVMLLFHWKIRSSWKRTNTIVHYHMHPPFCICVWLLQLFHHFGWTFLVSRKDQVYTYALDPSPFSYSRILFRPSLFCPLSCIITFWFFSFFFFYLKR